MALLAPVVEVRAAAIGGPVVAIGGLEVVLVAGTLVVTGGLVAVVLELRLSSSFAVVVAVDIQAAS